MSDFSYIIQKTTSGMETASITRCLSDSPFLEIPETLDGYPVTSLQPYAFSPTRQPETCQNLQELVLPKGLKQIGRYAFYGCTSLKMLTLPDSVCNIGAGLFVGCKNLAQLTYILYEDETRCCLKELLQELPQEILLILQQPNCSCHSPSLLQHAMHKTSGANADLQAAQKMPLCKLLFPAYFEESVENTPARITFSHIHGSGNYYRQCFLGGNVDFSKYDRQFPMAVAWERSSVLTELCFLRLEFPWHLTAQFQQQYLNYLKEHALFAGCFCLGIPFSVLPERLRAHQTGIHPLRLSQVSSGESPQMGGFDGTVLLTDSFSETADSFSEMLDTESLSGSSRRTRNDAERLLHLNFFLENVQPDRDTANLLLDLAADIQAAEYSGILMSYYGEHFAQKPVMKTFEL